MENRCILEVSFDVSGRTIKASVLVESREPIYSKICEVLKLVSLFVKYDGITISPLRIERNEE